MRHRHLAGGLLAVIALLVAGTPQAGAASDYFLLLPGIEGESTAQGHKGEIEIQSFSWGLNQTSGGGGGGGGAGKVNVQDISMLKTVDKSSPLLMVATASGRRFACATLTGVRGGEERRDFMRLKLEEVLVSSYQTSGSSGGGVPTDQISLSFGRIQFDYVPQNADGTSTAPVSAGWDFLTRKQFATQKDC